MVAPVTRRDGNRKEIAKKARKKERGIFIVKGIALIFAGSSETLEGSHFASPACNAKIPAQTNVQAGENCLK
jgi:hypothetical protein